MAKEQNVSVNLSSVPKEPYGASGGGPNSSLVGSPTAMPVEPEEEREASSAHSSTGCPGGGGIAVDPEVTEEGPDVSQSPSTKSKTPPESSSSSSPESDLELGAHYQMTYKSKDFPVPVSPERAHSVKRRLWDVDRKEVDESLSRELKRIRQEESVVKASKWNFDFEKDVPLRGTWVWEKTESPPDFYKTKECPKKKTTQSRYSPYEKTGSISQLVSSTSLPHTSSGSLVTSSRELTTLRSAVTSSSVSTPGTSTKEFIGSSVHSSSVLSEGTDVTQGSKALTESSETIHSVSRTATSTSSDPDIYSPDYFKPPTLNVEQCSRMEDIPKTSSSVSSSTIIASSSSASNNGSSCVSSSSSSHSKNDTESSSKDDSSSVLETSSKNGSGSSEPEASKTSSSAEQGIVPSRFYSSEADETKESGEQGADSSTTTRSSSSSAKPQEKRKLKTPKPSSSGSSSPSHLLKYYR